MVVIKVMVTLLLTEIMKIAELKLKTRAMKAGIKLILQMTLKIVTMTLSSLKSVRQMISANHISVKMVNVSMHAKEIKTVFKEMSAIPAVSV